MPKTSFDHHNKTELLDICKQFGVEVNANATKGELVARLGEDGVEYSLYEAMNPPAEEVEAAPAPVEKKPVEVPSGEKLLVKMTRKNASYEIRGVRFTRDNPFALVDANDAEYLINVIGDFQLALPTEVAKYYS